MTSSTFPLIAFCAVAMLGLSACATSAPSTQTASAAVAVASKTAPSTTTASAEGEEEQICKRTAIVGSKFKRKICGTKEHWNNVAAASRQQTRDAQNGPNGTSAN